MRLFKAITTLAVSMAIIGCSTETIKVSAANYKNVQGAIYQTSELTTYDLEATGYNETIINAKPEQVWAVLTNFTAMPKWTMAFLVQGALVDGNKVGIRHLVNGIVSDTQETIQVESGSLFSWVSKVPNTPEISGKYLFALEDTGTGKTRFVQSVRYQGSGKVNGEILTARRLSETQREAFVTFAQDLKTEVEKQFHK